MFSSLNIGDEINDNVLNEALKKLYYTDYFKQVEISLENEIVRIKLVENPIIQSVIIEGIDANSLNEKINEVTKKLKNILLLKVKLMNKYLFEEYTKILWLLFR